MPQSDMMRVSEAAKLLGIDRQAVYAAIRSGRLPQPKQRDAKDDEHGPRKVLLLKRKDVEQYAVDRRKQDAGKRRVR